VRPAARNNAALVGLSVRIHQRDDALEGITIGDEPDHAGWRGVEDQADVSSRHAGRKQLFSTTDSAVVSWTKMERPNIIMDNGHITHFTFAVTDVQKEQITGGSNHGTKVLVVAFDGATFDAETGVGAGGAAGSAGASGSTGAAGRGSAGEGAGGTGGNPGGGGAGCWRA